MSDNQKEYQDDETRVWAWVIWGVALTVFLAVSAGAGAVMYQRMKEKQQAAQEQLREFRTVSGRQTQRLPAGPASDRDLFATRGGKRYFHTWRLPDLPATALLRRSDYAGLDELAAELRADETRDSDGVWRLRSFYESVSMPRRENEATYREFFRRLQEWEQAAPRSVTPKVALAHAWVNYAWFARGSGYANTVGADGWDQMRERLATAAEFIAKAKEQDDFCPDIYAAEHGVILGDGSKEDYAKMFRAAVQQTPNYTDYYLSYAYSLLPRWHGEDEREWEKMARIEADRLGGDDGDEMYARIAVHIFGFEKNIFAARIADWARVKRGFAVMRRRYPQSGWNRNAYAVLACASGDRAAAKQGLAQLGTPYLSLWQTNTYLQAARDWSGGQRPDLPPYPAD